MEKEILEIKDLSIKFNRSGQYLVDSVSFTVPKKTITGIVGESGSGKSLTALSLLGLLPNGISISSGKAVYGSSDKHDLFQQDNNSFNRIRGKEISMIFQEPMTSLNPSMKCGKQVEESIRHHQRISSDNAKTRILELFKKTELPDPKRIYSSYPHQLSGGQRQRLMIAMALANNPKLLIADEPTTALDVSVQKSIIDLLRNLQQEFSLSIIFITHDLRLLGEIAEQIIVMRNGRLVEKGSKTKIFSQADDPYTRGLLECQPPLHAKPKRLRTISDFEAGKPAVNDYLSAKNPEILQTTEKNEILLSVKELKVSYKRKSGFLLFGTSKFNAVNKVSFDLYKGETLGLVGESGCGKTTLGKTLLMLTEKDDGNIIFKGKKLNEMKSSERARFRKNVQVVFQDPYSSLNPRMKIGVMLSEVRKIHFPGENSGSRKKKLKSLLLKSGMSAEDLNKYPHEFSGGQRQRIGIIRALTTEPELLVLDESVSALDVSVQAQILNLLNDLKEEFQLSYIFISHDLAVVKYMSDRIIVMKDGIFEELGSSDDIYKNPDSEYTRKLINAVPGYQNSSGSL